MPCDRIVTMKWNWIASGLIVVMLTYFVVDNHSELYPWNNLVSSQLPSTLAALIPFAVYAAAFALAPSLECSSAPWTAMSGWRCKFGNGGFRTCSDPLRCTEISGGISLTAEVAPTRFSRRL